MITQKHKFGFKPNKNFEFFNVEQTLRHKHENGETV